MLKNAKICIFGHFSEKIFSHDPIITPLGGYIWQDPQICNIWGGSFRVLYGSYALSDMHAAYCLTQ